MPKCRFCEAPGDVEILGGQACRSCFEIARRIRNHHDVRRVISIAKGMDASLSRYSRLGLFRDTHLKLTGWE